MDVDSMLESIGAGATCQVSTVNNKIHCAECGCTFYLSCDESMFAVGGANSRRLLYISSLLVRSLTLSQCLYRRVFSQYFCRHYIFLSFADAQLAYVCLNGRVPLKVGANSYEFEDPKLQQKGPCINKQMFALRRKDGRQRFYAKR